jgi:hypothetical protein
MVVHPSSKRFASLEATLTRLVGSVKEETNGREKGKGKMAQGKTGIGGKLCIPRCSCDVKVEFVVIPIAMIKFSTDKTTIDTFYDYLLTDN